MYGATASERGDIVLGWLTRVVVILAFVALVVFDTMAIITARLGVADDADSAAEAANQAWSENHGNVEAAYNAAAGYADQHGETCPLRDFSVSSTGVVHLRLDGKATTLVANRIGPLKKLAAVHASGEATTPEQ